jgi:hypothetical protein
MQRFADMSAGRSLGALSSLKEERGPRAKRGSFQGEGRDYRQPTGQFDARCAAHFDAAKLGAPGGQQ